MSRRVVDCGFTNRMMVVTPHYYRTHHQAEVDLVLEGDFGIVPIEIKLGTVVDERRTGALRDFMTEHGCKFGLVINNAARVATLAPNIYQVPAAAL